MQDSSLSEAGRIYAEEHGVLEAARSEFRRFLDEVCASVQGILQSPLSVLEPFVGRFTSRSAGSVWFRHNVSLVAIENRGPFRAGREELWVGYGDATVRNPPGDALTAWVAVELAGPLFRKLSSIDASRVDDAYTAAELHGIRLDRTTQFAYYTTVKMKPTSSRETAEAISELIGSIFLALLHFASKLEAQS